MIGYLIGVLSGIFGTIVFYLLSITLNKSETHKDIEKVDYDILNAIVQADDDRVFFSVKNGSEKDVKVSIYTISRDVEKAKTYWLNGTIRRSKIEADRQDLNIDVGRVIKIVDLDKEEPSSGSTYTPSPKMQRFLKSARRIDILAKIRDSMLDAWECGHIHSRNGLRVYSQKETLKRLMKELEDL